jgi:hypothetical protein
MQYHGDPGQEILLNTWRPSIVWGADQPGPSERTKAWKFED